MGLGDIFRIKQFKVEISQLKTEISQLRQLNEQQGAKLDELGAYDYYQIKEKITSLRSVYEQKKRDEEAGLQRHLASLNTAISEKLSESHSLSEKIADLVQEEAKLSRGAKTQANKLNRSKELVRAVNYALENYFNYEPSQTASKILPNDLTDLEQISPSVILKLHCMDVKDLRKAYRENDKQINSVLEKYSSRYTTKANQAIYKLMVIALRAELQNILYNLKYEKLDKSTEDVKSVTKKYLKISTDGNQSIAGTLTKFIGEIEYLFINAVKIEYNYYVKKEQAKQEQLAIREQMRQEAEERKALEAERKKVEREESKYKTEIEKIQEQLQTAQEEEMAALNSRILELRAQLSNVVLKKEEISNLANGKAGNVYIISNMGSFGENVFKVGMTRRLEPQDRINELGNASVPFKFDVHSFIFSDDAVGLESELHRRLEKDRVNKVNRRKEFFYTSIDDLEKLVTEIAPTAEFNRTMLAEEFHQSQASDSTYNTDWISDEEE